MQDVFRRRRLIALGVVAGIVLLIWACRRLEAVAAGRPQGPPELPRGGRVIFPHYRVVAYYGAPQNDELGVLGIGTPDQAATQAARPRAHLVRPAAAGRCCRRSS